MRTGEEESFQPVDKTKEKLSPAMKACNDILKEIFSKKHSVSITSNNYFYLIRSLFAESLICNFHFVELRLAIL